MIITENVRGKNLRYDDNREVAKISASLSSKTYKYLLSHRAKCNMENIFRVSHILQLISRDFRRVK